MSSWDLRQAGGRLIGPHHLDHMADLDDGLDIGAFQRALPHACVGGGWSPAGRWNRDWRLLVQARWLSANSTSLSLAELAGLDDADMVPSGAMLISPSSGVMGIGAAVALHLMAVGW